MGDTVTLQTKQARLDADIEGHIEILRTTDPLKLPDADSPLIELYVRKIEGTYDIGRAKRDTDNAIALLYIAYNTTPQEEGDIRVAISKIMSRLIVAQKDTELAMRKAGTLANGITGTIPNVFKRWKGDRDCKGPDDKEGLADLKEFLTTDLLKMAKYISDRALDVKTMLDVVAGTYDGIIEDTQAATTSSEHSLAKRLGDQAALQRQIVESNAKRESLEQLVADLTAQVETYDKKAKEFADRAGNAEERAFIMSIVQVGAQMVAAIVPGVVTALTASATGGASVVAGAAASTVARAVGDKNAAEAKADPTDTEVITKKREVAAKALEAKKLKGKIDGLRTDVTALEGNLAKEKSKAAPAAGKDAAAGKDTTTAKKKGKAKDATPAGKDKDAPAGKEKPKDDVDDATDTDAVKAAKRRLTEKQAELTENEEKYSTLIGVLSGLQAGLTALEKGLGQMTQKAEDAATGLRKLQMQMLDKVETYEKERRAQNAELVLIRALLSGNLSEKETLQLAIQSLNVSLSALKKTQEIVIELSAFFKSFAAFMDQIGVETQVDIDLFDDVASSTRIKSAYLLSLIENGDKFFLRQLAEWYAVRSVSATFEKTFADGWSQLNRLNGTYIKGDALKAYLKVAEADIERIVADREADAENRVVTLDSYRKQIVDSATRAA